MLTGLGAPGILLSLSSQCWESNILNRIIVCLRQGLAVFKSGFGLIVLLPPTPGCHNYECVPPCLVTDSILINLIGIILNIGNNAWPLCRGWRKICPHISKLSIVLTEPAWYTSVSNNFTDICTDSLIFVLFYFSRVNTFKINLHQHETS